MLGTKLCNRFMNSVPRINPILGIGVAYHQSHRIEKYIREIIDCAKQSFPPGLKFMGCRRATPEEQIMEITRTRRGRRVFELAPSDVYMCVYQFEFNGEKLKPQYLELPYIRPGGIIKIRGSSHVVSPVLEDNIFSVSSDQIYMPVTRAKLTFKKLDVSYKVDGHITSAAVVYSAIHNISRKKKHSSRVTTLMHYLLGEYGLSETINRYYNVGIVTGEQEINSDTYPEDDWVICSSAGLKPKGRMYGSYIPTMIRIAVPRKDFTPEISNAIGGFYYVVDRMPDVVTVDYLDNRDFWRRLLAYFIKSTVDSEIKAMEEIDVHYDSLYSYIDDLVRMRLTRENVPSDSLFDVLNYVMNNFVNMTMESDPADMLRNKRVDTIRPLMADVVYAISTLTFELRRMQGDRLNLSNINGLFDKRWPQSVIKRIGNGHGEVNTLESATDNFLYSVTKLLVPQPKATFTKRSSKDADMTDPAYALHPTQPLVTTYLFITKSDPSARSAINHFMPINEAGEMLFDQQIIDDVSELYELLSTK